MNFLLNLARRGAGLPATEVQPLPPSPFEREIHPQGNGLVEMITNVPSEGFSESSAEAAPAPEAQPTEQSLGVASLSLSTPIIQRVSPTDQPLPKTAMVQEAAAPTPSESLSQQPLKIVTRNAVEGIRERDVRKAPLETPDLALGGTQSLPRSLSVPGIETFAEPGRDSIDSTRQSIQSGLPEIQTVSVLPERQGPVLPEPRVEKPPNEPQDQRELVRSVPPIRPATSDSTVLHPFPKAASAVSTTRAAQLPIHVRIGRVEVRETPAPAAAAPNAPTPLGFASYHRIRNYRG